MTTKLLIDRELLEQVASEFEHDNDRYMLGRELRKVLDTPRQPEGEGVGVVAYMDHHDTLSHDAPRTAHFALMTVAQHQRLMAAEIQKRFDGNEQSSREHREELAQRDAKLAGVVEALRSKFPLIDPNKPYPINENLHHIEWHLMRERERLHKTIDAALAAAGVDV